MHIEIYTEDSLKYTFFPLTQGSLKFRVKAPNDAHIALTSGSNENGPKYEIIIGGWNNTRSAIRRDSMLPNKAEASTPNIVSSNYSRDFWINWKSGYIKVGRGDQATPFLTYNDPYPFPIGHYGLRTGWDSEGQQYNDAQWSGRFVQQRRSVGFSAQFTSQWTIEGSRNISTPWRQPYQFWPIPCGAITVDVRCRSDAHITLISSPTPANHETYPRLEVFIGGFSNTRSAIRKDGTEPDRISSSTPGIVSDFEFRRFRVRWNNGKISLLPGSSSLVPIFEYYDGNPVGVTHFGIRTARGSSGQWKIREGDEAVSSPTITIPPITAPPATPTEWVNSVAGIIPAGAFIGGRDHSCDLYVGRAHHEGDFIPGKVNPQYKQCYVAYNGKEHGKSDYQVLCGTDLKWESCSKNNIPANAVHGGNTKTGEPLYVGRVSHKGTLAVGKVHPSHGVCYISYGGDEHGYQNYEILVYK